MTQGPPVFATNVCEHAGGRRGRGRGEKISKQKRANVEHEYRHRKQAVHNSRAVRFCETRFTECLVRGFVVSVVSASYPPLPRPYMRQGLLATPPGWRSPCAQDVHRTPHLVAVQHQSVLQRSAPIPDTRCNRHSTTQCDLARPPPSEPEIILAVGRAQKHL